MAPRLLIKGGSVLALSPRSPNFARGDVLVDDGIVVEVGESIRARDAEVIDATDAIVMPGFVDTHRHVWQSLFRNFGPIGGAVVPPVAVGHFTAEDLYASTLIGLLGAVEAGITTVVDWSDVPAGVGLSEAALQAHADSGLRTVLVSDPRTAGDLDFAEIRALRDRLDSQEHVLTTIAVGAVTPVKTTDERVSREWAAARDLGLRIHAHAGMKVDDAGGAREILDPDLLADDTTLVHLLASQWNRARCHSFKLPKI